MCVNQTQYRKDCVSNYCLSDYVTVGVVCSVYGYIHVQRLNTYTAERRHNGVLTQTLTQTHTLQTSHDLLQHSSPRLVPDLCAEIVY